MGVPTVETGAGIDLNIGVLLGIGARIPPCPPTIAAEFTGGAGATFAPVPAGAGVTLVDCAILGVGCLEFGPLPTFCIRFIGIAGVDAVRIKDPGTAGTPVPGRPNLLRPLSMSNASFSKGGVAVLAGCTGVDANNRLGIAGGGIEMDSTPPKATTLGSVSLLFIPSVMSISRGVTSSIAGEAVRVGAATMGFKTSTAGVAAGLSSSPAVLTRPG